MPPALACGAIEDWDWGWVREGPAQGTPATIGWFSTGRSPVSDRGEKMKRKDDFLMQNVGGQNLLVPLGSRVMDMNGVVTLNETGVFAWNLLEKDCSADELAAAVAERFDVSPERASADIQTFVDEIAGMGLLER
jgi:hypothetical protein